ncbi:uncharacterized protein BcabD6B2_38930 [Babesia caballi]|uniref:C2 NT-type domain-containing protein n=1 Tax=Babesia caballi TaxID=5871 RepID=A0AAV4LXH9_BABCB|nr:hypothetical protein, conserved [Babesia caballi]
MSSTGRSSVSTGRSSASSRNSYSTHSFLFAFHVKSVLLSSQERTGDDSLHVRLAWSLSPKGYERDPWAQQGDDGTHTGSNYTSAPFDLDGAGAKNVDTAFPLLQCHNGRGNKMSVQRGSLTVAVVVERDNNTCLAATTLDLSVLVIEATLNLISVHLKNRRGALVGSLELCYVSQQRWVKVNKRKLSFLNSDSSSCVNSVAETSANDATSVLEGTKQTTRGQQEVTLKTLTPRADEYVLIFWNSANVCFVKNHPEDYQLQLMLNFVQTHLCRSSADQSGAEQNNTWDVSGASTMQRVESFSQTADSVISSSRAVPNSGILEFPDFGGERTAASEFTSTSPFISDFEGTDSTGRSSASVVKEPGSVRLLDYLSHQDRIIQSHLTRQLSADASSSSSWTSCTWLSAGMPLPNVPPRNAIRTPTPVIAFSVTASTPATVYRDSANPPSCISSAFERLSEGEEYSDLGDLSVANGIAGRVVVRNPDAVAPLRLDDVQGLTNPHNRLNTDDRWHEGAFDTANSFATRQKTQPVKDASFSRDTTGSTLPTSFQFNSNALKHNACLKSSVSTVDSGSISPHAEVSKAIDWGRPEDAAVLSTVAPVSGKRAANHVVHHEELFGTGYDLDIVEDVHCSVVIEDVTPLAMADDFIDVNRFYAEDDDYLGAFDARGSLGSGRCSTINNFYMGCDDVDLDISEPSVGRASRGAPREALKGNLVSAVYNAVTAEISAMSVEDLGVDHAECSLDVMSDALNDARALQLQQDKMSNDLLMNFFLQLLHCYCQKGVPQVMLMQDVVQKHLSAASLMQFLPAEYNPTVIRVALDILVRQLGMSLPAGRPNEAQLGTDYIAPQHAASGWPDPEARSATIRDELVQQRSFDLFASVSECETYSEVSTAEECFVPLPEVARREAALRRLHVVLDEMQRQIKTMDSRKLVYVSRMHSKPMKKRGCGLPLLAVKLALYHMFCGRRKLPTQVNTKVLV